MTGWFYPLESETGRLMWTDTIDPHDSARLTGAAIWSAPTIDAKRGLLYITTGDNSSTPATATSDAVMALARTSGRMPPRMAPW